LETKLSDLTSCSLIPSRHLVCSELRRHSRIDSLGRCDETSTALCGLVIGLLEQSLTQGHPGALACGFGLKLGDQPRHHPIVGRAAGHLVLDRSREIHVANWRFRYVEIRFPNLGRIELCQCISSPSSPAIHIGRVP